MKMQQSLAARPGEGIGVCMERGENVDMKNERNRIRRRLLRPLTPSSRQTSDLRIYSEALRRLDDRVNGELALHQIRNYLHETRSPANSGEQKDPVRAAKMVALAKVLYASRRISRHEYVFYAASPVEGVHDRRLMDGQYKTELEWINRALMQIHEEYGLGPDEYWPRGRGPKRYIELNRQYDEIVATQFRKALEEFGLEELAALVENSPEEFHQLRERGRRSVFHREEDVLVLQDIILQNEKEAREAAKVGAYSVAITALGTAVEGLLLLRCLNSPRKSARVSQQLPRRLRPRNPGDPTSWRFEQLIEVCLAAEWLTPVETSIAQYNTAGLAHLLRHVRNYVHPGKRARERPWSATDEREYQDVDAIYAVLSFALRKFRKKRR